MCISRIEKCGYSPKGAGAGHWGPACSAPSSLVTLWLPPAAAGLSQGVAAVTLGTESPGAPSFSGHVKSLSGWLCLPDSPLPALMSRCLPVPSSCGWTKTWPPAPTITPLVTSGPDSWLISLPYSVPTWPRSCPVGPLSLCSAPWGQVS